MSDERDRMNAVVRRGIIIVENEHPPGDEQRMSWHIYGDDRQRTGTTAAYIRYDKGYSDTGCYSEKGYDTGNIRRELKQGKRSSAE